MKLHLATLIQVNLTHLAISKRMLFQKNESGGFGLWACDIKVAIDVAKAVDPFTMSVIDVRMPKPMCNE